MEFLWEDLITAPAVDIHRSDSRAERFRQSDSRFLKWIWGPPLVEIEQQMQALKEMTSPYYGRTENPRHRLELWSEHPFRYVEPLWTFAPLTKKSQVDSEVYVRCRKYSSRKISKPYPRIDESSKRKKKEIRLRDLLVAMNMAAPKCEKDATMEMEKLLFSDGPQRVIYNPIRLEFGGKQQLWLQSGQSQQDDGEQSLKSATPIKQENQPANYENKIGEIEEMLLRAGALRARDLHKQDGTHGWVSCSGWDWGWRKPSSHAEIMSAIVSPKRESASCVLLLMATVLAAVTYRAAFTPPLYAYNHGANANLGLGKQDSTVTHSFIVFNSTVFFGSLSIMIFLLHDFPLKPWPQITVSTLIGSYMCAIVATSPTLALALFFLATPFLVFAAAAKFHGFPRVMSYYNS